MIAKAKSFLDEGGVLDQVHIVQGSYAEFEKILERVSPHPQPLSS